MIFVLRYEDIVCDMSGSDINTGKQISVEEFVQAGRTGRRNALPDILSVTVATCGTSDLTKALQKLHTSPGAYALINSSSADSFTDPQHAVNLLPHFTEGTEHNSDAAKQDAQASK